MNLFIQPSLFFQELKKLLKLAAPIMVTQFAQTANGFVDTFMSGQIGSVDLASIALGSGIWLPIYLLIVGILIGATPIIARYNGENNFSQLPFITQQALYLSGLIGLIGAIATYFSPLILSLMAIKPELIPITTHYLHAIAFGIPAISFFTVLRSFCEGLGHSKPAMFISILGLICNIFANYIFMYGLFGLPELGSAGCGYATSLVMWLMCFFMLSFIHYSHLSHHAQLFSKWTLPHIQSFKTLLAIGIPIGLAIFFETSIFSVIALFLGKKGAIIVAGHQIALNFSSLIFMIPLSIAMALTIRVSHAMGEKNKLKTKIICLAGLYSNIIIALIMATCIYFFRFKIAAIYTDTQAVIQLSAQLLIFSAIFQLSDGLQVASNGALRGFKETKSPMFITLAGYWFVGLPIGYYLGEIGIYTPLGAHGFWIGLIIGLTTTATLLLSKLAFCIRCFDRYVTQPITP